MVATANLALALLEANQAQPALALNAPLRVLDAIVQAAVDDMVDAVEGISPELSAVDGDRYIINSTGQIAVHWDGAWDYLTPLVGWLVFVRDEALFYKFSDETSPPSWVAWNAVTILPGEWAASKPYQVQEYDDDLVIGAPHWATSGAVTWTGEAGVPGIMVLTTTTSATSAVATTFDPDDAITLAGGRWIVGAGEIELEMRVRISQLGTGTDTYIWRVGLVDELNSAPGNGIYFGTVNTTGVWQYTVRNGTATFDDDDTSLTPTADSWHTIRIVINAAGTSVAFYVDDVLRSTITTNIPTDPLRVGMSIVKSAGSAVITAEMDHFRIRQTFTATRFP